MERITNVNIKEFLKDWEVNSEIELLEEAQTKKDIISIAKAKGIDLKNNTDLAGFKCTYAFANKANRNGARLPKEALLKALPSMIGKPVNIDHQRRYVVGHYIDYSYNKKEDKVIGYGVIYKSNFDEEWEKAQKLFKAKKLTTSYEIWCPEKKRRHLSDGTYELLEQAIAGGAILFKEKPAFKDAKVLELAMKRMEKEKDLVFASTEKDKDLIIAEKDINQVLQPISIKCANCNNGFNTYPANEIKCPSCLAIVNKEGNMIYPPQKKDFQIMCPACKSSHWKILSRDKETAKIKCLNETICGKTYQIIFSNAKKENILSELNFLYMSTVSCIQCGKRIEVIGTSNTTTKQIKCSKCGLEYSYDIKGDKTYKKISAIEEIAIETSEKGGTEMKDKKEEMKASEEQVEKSEKQEDKDPKADNKEAQKKEVVEKAEEKESEVKVEKEKVEETKTPETEKAKETPKAEEDIEEKVEKYPKTKNLRTMLKKVKALEESSTKADNILVKFKKLASRYIELKKSSTKKIEFYKANAQEIIKRRTTLGDYEISDKDIMDNKKFEKAQLELEQAKIKEENKTTNDVVGIKEKASDYYTSKRKEIHDKAFGRKESEE